MQRRAEMPKSMGQGVSRGTKRVPAPGLVLPAAVWVTGQWEVLVKLAVAERFGGDFRSVNITFVCGSGIGCYISSYRTVLKVWSANCQRSGRLFVSSFYVSSEHCSIIRNTFVVSLLRAVCSLLGRSWFLCFSFSFLITVFIVIPAGKALVLANHLDIDLSLCGLPKYCGVCNRSTSDVTEMSCTFGGREFRLCGARGFVEILRSEIPEGRRVTALNDGSSTVCHLLQQWSCRCLRLPFCLRVGVFLSAYVDSCACTVGCQ